MNHDWEQNIKERLVNLEKLQKKQMDYAGLFMKSVTDLCKPSLTKKIIYRHFDLMKEYDEKRDG